MDPIKLIENITVLSQLFIPGYVFIYFYGWLAYKKFETHEIIINSLIMSLIIKGLWALLHSILFTKTIVTEPYKSAIYCITGFVLSILLYLIRDKIDSIWRKITGKSISDNLLDLVINPDGTIVRLFIKNSDITYIGALKYYEEKEMNSLISLVNYQCLDNNNDNVKCYGDISNSTLVIPLSEIARMELLTGEIN